MKLLAPGGRLYFSNNLRSFKLDEKLPILYQVEDLGPQSIPEDFRNKRIHNCFLLRHPGD
jgi:23S rRNA (cytosine1962-C5)-methyltransferase